MIWGETRGGTARLLEISDGGACRATLSDFGARLVSLWTPDRKGTPADIVLGHDTPAEYETPASRYVGATCGRYANRIAGGRFTLDGATVQLDRNENGTHLHGGTQGFDIRLWRLDAADAAQALFSLHSAHGDMGFPGELSAQVRYAFTAPFTLDITMSATVAGHATVVNLVNHAYFNLAGQGSGPVDGQNLQIDAEGYLPVNDRLIPAAGPTPVAGTPFDFRRMRPIGTPVPPGGFDHNFCLTPGPAPQVRALDPMSGRGFTLHTDQPGVQLYTAGHIPPGLPGKAGARIGPRAGFALETQRWPDSPNRPDFPSAVLRPGQVYEHRMTFDLRPDPGTG